ncbi:MAG: hypothetical protein ABL961_11685 [Vicinamibacterales bacterium]
MAPHGEPAPLFDAIRRSWPWVSALTEHFHLVVDVVDRRGQSCRPSDSALRAGGKATSVDALLSDPAVQRTIGEVFERGAAQRLMAGGLEWVFAPMTLAGDEALLVAGRSRRSDTADATLDLTRLVTALARGVEADGQDRVEHVDEEFDRVSSLYRRLHEAVERGSEIEVVRSFAEAVFAWDGVEVSGYVHDLHGDLALQVTSPGASRGRELVKHAPTFSSGALQLLSAEDATLFGFDRGRTLLVADVRTPALDSWTLIFAEGFGQVASEPVRLYVDLLRDALNRAAAIAETRLVWAAMQPLLGTTDPQVAAGTALAELSRLLPAHSITLTANTESGSPLLSVGDDDAQSTVRPFGPINRLVARSKTTDGVAVALLARRSAREAFTRREQHLLDRLVGVFATWLARVVKQRRLQPERRSEPQNFAQILDRAAIQASREGDAVALVIVRMTDVVGPHAVLPAWVVDLRTRLRGTDLAGPLSDHEVGVLLRGVGADDLVRIATRIGDQAAKAMAGSERPSIGVASRIQGSTVEGSLVHEARQDAARRQRQASKKRG